MVDVKLGKKIFNGVHTVKLNTLSHGKVLFHENQEQAGRQGLIVSAIGFAGLNGAKANTRLGSITTSAEAVVASE